MHSESGLQNQQGKDLKFNPKEILSESKEDLLARVNSWDMPTLLFALERWGGEIENIPGLSSEQIRSLVSEKKTSAMLPGLGIYFTTKENARAMVEKRILEKLEEIKS
ncbi:MAG: hypothetical protein K2X37_08820 [Chitinophagaceae bacterium]|nr:hypothetical protein [Chitinophagaceae bacterium]